MGDIDPERTKQTATGFLDTVYNQHDVGAIERFVAEDYRQHNPNMPDGRQPLIDWTAGILAKYPEFRMNIKRVLGENDLAVVHSHAVAFPGHAGKAVIDIFRIRDGKVVEHWDVAQDVPTEAANDNGMF